MRIQLLKILLGVVLVTIILLIYLAVNLFWEIGNVNRPRIIREEHLIFQAPQTFGELEQNPPKKAVKRVSFNEKPEILIIPNNSDNLRAMSEEPIAESAERGAGELTEPETLESIYSTGSVEPVKAEESAESIKSAESIISTKSTKPTKPTKATEYLQTLNRHADDPQNVHDNQVIKSLSIKYARLLELHNKRNEESYKQVADAGISVSEFRITKINSCMEEFRQYVSDALSKKIRDNIITQDEATITVKKISVVMAEIKKARALVSLTQGNEIVREDWIFTLIWEHINHVSDSKNSENAENLRESLMFQLADCAVKREVDRQTLILLQILGLIQNFQMPEYTTVCINGRVGRMISSMTLIDTDPILSAPEKDEAEISNEIYTKVSNIVEKKLAEDMKIRDLYVKLEEDLSYEEREQVDKFRTEMKVAVRGELNKEYGTLIPGKKLDELIEKSLEGI